MGCDAYAMLDENAYEGFMRLSACLTPRVLQPIPLGKSLPEIWVTNHFL